MPVASAGDTRRHAVTVTEETVDDYAAVTGDDNPLHTDDEYAAEGLFGGRVAHGMFTAGVVSAALAALDGDIVYVSQEFSFEAPVRPGDTVAAEVEVLEELGGDRLRVETVAESVADQAATDADDTDGEVVLTGEATVLSVPHDD
ncbi:MaoC family dehydratase [Halobaculum sp. MBLA0143]|uniref:MaoC family dehydratase n=1 Tax=Halobaculum sp. MBLA0143 TaxID=3079933 RepID=UPI0035266D2E